MTDNTTHQELLALSLACKEAGDTLASARQKLRQLGYTWHYVDTNGCGDTLSM